MCSVLLRVLAPAFYGLLFWELCHGGPQSPFPGANGKPIVRDGSLDLGAAKS